LDQASERGSGLADSEIGIRPHTPLVSARAG
ncbi:MAG: hypothetical protein QOG88_1600, partial [Actinomycetota bacterium]|nr:hypothetical protein [Actinomycetota bacterium]